MRTNARLLGSSLIALVLVVGCTAQVDGTGTGEEDVTGSGCVLTSYNGYDIFKKTCSDPTYKTSFYTKNGNTYSASGVRTGLEWQCVEWSVRYSHFVFDTKTAWGVAGATDMCGTHPSTMSKVTSPWKGDVVVFKPGACLKKNSAGTCIGAADATYGHTGIVYALPSSGVVGVKDQNGFQNASNSYLTSAVQCYLRDSHHVCESGTKRACTDAYTCSGTQTCNAEGNAWGACTSSSVCTPGDSRMSCSSWGEGPDGTCCGSCGYETETCTSSCEWGSHSTCHNGC